MLDDYVEEQKIVTTIFKNAVLKNKHSHAYLLETNGYHKANEIAISFAKFLQCSNHYSNNKQCGDCPQCRLIDQNLFSEVKIIEPNGIWIKKEQMDSLQKDFNQTAIQSNYRIYIIKNAEKMNIATANSILKFLEEPAPNIIAILITDNIYQLLDTIVSRCQIISLKHFNKDNESMYEKLANYVYLPNSVDKLSIQEYVQAIIKFVECLENKGNSILLNTQSLWHKIIDDRDKTLMSFDLLTLLYKDILNKKLQRKIEFYNEYVQVIDSIQNKNETKQLIQKIKLIDEFKEKIKLNVNQNLLIDSFILEMGCIA